MSFHSKLLDLLQTDPRFVDDDGELVLAAVQDAAWKIDHALVKRLLSNKEIKAKFFDEIDGHWIFNVNTFLEYISQKNFLDNSYTRFRNRIGLTIDGKYLRERGEVALVWAYKDTVLEGGQTKEEEKRKEIFFNEVLAQDEINRLLDPKVLTNFTRYTAKGKQAVKDFKRDENGVIRENLIIKGNNLLALHTLKTQFRGRVKLIYIDPPYNTGDDSFGYNDSFNHSSWLTFIKNRLEVARDLLCDDGAIFIQINDNEEAYLKVLCDEVFGRENFHTAICVQMSHLSGVKMAHKEKKLPKIKEYILFYTKTNAIKLNPQYIPATWDDALERYSSFVKKNGYTDDNCSKWEVITLNQAIKDAGIDAKDKKAVLDFKLNNADLIFRTARNRGADYSAYNPSKFTKIDNIDGTYYFVYKNEDVSFAADKVLNINGKKTPVVSLGDIWTDIGINNLSNEGGVDLRFGKKPEKLIERLIKLISNSPNDIVMDFFAGSGTTGAVAHKLNRQYLLVEQLDSHSQKMTSRLSNVIKGEESGVSKENNWQGGGDFIYCELMKYNEAFMERIQAAQSSEELVQIWREMAEGSFLNWYVNPAMPEEAIKDFMAIGEEPDPLRPAFGGDTSPKSKGFGGGRVGVEKQKRLLAELLDKNQLYVNLSEIDDAQFKVSQEDKALNKAFYGE